MRKLVAAVLLVPCLAAAMSAQDAVDGCARLPFSDALLQCGDPFPHADPEEIGLDPGVLEALASVVMGHVDGGDIVGAELLVIKNRRTVLHRAYGWQDREAERPMTVDTIFNIRSMTKPLTGFAANLLIEDGLLSLDDRVAGTLDGFDAAPADRITIEQLLTHRSGLPLSILAEVDEYASLREMGEAVGRRGPEFPPGSTFHYSDAGTDVLGAVVERVSGRSLDAFVTERLLEPLGMNDSFYYTVAGGEDVRTDRIASLYTTQGIAWSRFWEPDEPLYPAAWGSQTLHSTPKDYARFLALLLDGGRWWGHRIASPESVSRMLRPTSPMMALGGGMRFPTAFYGLEPYYGQMIVLYSDVADPEHTPVVIGHSGSDGTYAWAWPDRDLMILLFTQSRGSTVGIAFEAEIDRLLIHPEIERLNAEAAERYAGLLGTYVDRDDPTGRNAVEVIVQNGGLAMDVPWQVAYALTPATVAGRWDVALLPQTQLQFEHDAAGRAAGFRLLDRGGSRLFLRGMPTEIAYFNREDVAALLGRYEHNLGEMEVVLCDGVLALMVPDAEVPLELLPPRDEAWWTLALNPAVAIRFDRDASGAVISLTARTPAGLDVHLRIHRAESSDATNQSEP